MLESKEQCNKSPSVIITSGAVIIDLHPCDCETHWNVSLLSGFFTLLSALSRTEVWKKNNWLLSWTYTDVARCLCSKLWKAGVIRWGLMEGKRWKFWLYAFFYTGKWEISNTAGLGFALVTCFFWLETFFLLLYGLYPNYFSLWVKVQNGRCKRRNCKLWTWWARLMLNDRRMGSDKLKKLVYNVF